MGTRKWCTLNLKSDGVPLLGLREDALKAVSDFEQRVQVVAWAHLLRVDNRELIVVVEHRLSDVFFY